MRLRAEMSCLPENRGCEAVPCSVEAEAPAPRNMFLGEENTDVVYGEVPVARLFWAESFGIVLSCGGVLGHVEDEGAHSRKSRASCCPGEMCVVMMLPNRRSCAGFMARNIFRASDCDRPYAIGEMCALLSQSGLPPLCWFSGVVAGVFLRTGDA